LYRPSRAVIAVLTAVCSIAVAGLALLAGAAPAGAAPAPRTYGHFTSAFQYRNGTVRASGDAIDISRPGTSIKVCVVVSGKCVRAVRASRTSTAFNRRAHVRGRHGFVVNLPRQRPGVVLKLRSVSGAPHHLARIRVSTAGSRVVRVAKRYVGHRYVYGGASPRTGFDCSGLAMYSYLRASVAQLPHNAEAQRHVRHMRRISRSAALPGDLIFYLGGGSAYHVAIYAGHGMEYSAADPADGIRYERVWGSNVQFGTNWH
jgi:cell wall-associated NlpC family hydrolase